MFIRDNMGKYTRYRYNGKDGANNPTNLIDPDGERIVVTDYFSSRTESNNVYEWTLVGEEWQFVDFFTGIPYVIGSSSYIDALIKTLEFEMRGPNGKMYIEKLVELHEIVAIDYNIGSSRENRYFPQNNYILKINNKNVTLFGAINWYSPDDMKANNIKYHKSLEKGTFKYTFEESAFSLLHELAHFYDHATGRDMDKEWNKVSSKSKFISESEIYATFVENVIRSEHGAYLRTRYKSMKLLKYNGRDALIDKDSKASLYYTSGDIFNTNFENLKKSGDYGFKYK